MLDSIMNEAPNNPETPLVTEQAQKMTQIKKSSRWPLITVIILAIVALAAAGFFAYQNYQLKQKASFQKDTLVISPEPTEELIPIPTTDPTGSWFTFTKKDFCYSFKYPQEVTFNDEEIIRLSLWGPTQKKDTEFYDGLSLTFSSPLQIGSLSLSDFIDNEIANIQAEDMAEVTKAKQPILINGVNGYTFTVQGLGTFKNIYLQSPNKTCTVEITNATVDPTNQGYQETVDKILSTFQFAD